jgi:hypothetical protein
MGKTHAFSRRKTSWFGAAWQNPKLQAPNSNEIPSSKLQSAEVTTHAVIDI